MYGTAISADSLLMWNEESFPCVSTILVSLLCYEESILLRANLVANILDRVRRSGRPGLVLITVFDSERTTEGDAGGGGVLCVVHVLSGRVGVAELLLLNVEVVVQALVAELVSARKSDKVSESLHVER